MSTAGSTGRLAGVLLIALALPLAACGRRLHGPLPAVVVKGASQCRAAARLPFAGGELVNNAWNAAAAGAARWRQCVGLGVADGARSVAWWDWHWPGRAAAVYAYPGWLAGASPWLDEPGNDPRFPIAIATTGALWVAHDASLRSTGAYDLSTSAWLVRPTPGRAPAERDIATAIMVWTDYTPETVAHPEPTTLRAAFVDADGRRWQLWAAEGWGDDTGASPQRWTHVVFLLDRAQRTGRLRYDLMALIGQARRLGLVTPDQVIADIEFGTELLGGDGRLVLRGIGLDVVPLAPAGSEIRANAASAR